MCDFLDGSLHASILSSLAGNLASSSQHDDLSLLTDTFSSVSPATNGVLNSVISRLAPNAFTSDQEEFITLQQAESMIAFAEYSAQATPSVDDLARILSLLRALPSWEVEALLGTQASQDWALPDQLAYAFVSAVLTITSKDTGNRSAALSALSNLQKQLVDQIKTAPGDRIIGHLLPALNGTRRAFTSTPFPWTFADPTPHKIALEDSNIDAVVRATTQDWDINTPDGRLALATLKLYHGSTKGLAAGLIPVSTLEAQQAFLCSAFAGKSSSWDSLVSDTEKRPSVQTRGELKSGITDALGVFSKTVKLIAEDLDGSSTDVYAFDILLSSLTVATLHTISSGTLDLELVALLEMLASELSPVVDEAVQVRAVEALEVLAHSFPQFLPQATKIVRQFIVTPSAIFEREGESSASLALLVASRCYANCILLANDSGLPLSAIQSLFNHFTSYQPIAPAIAGDDGTIRPELQGEKVSINVVHATSRLAQEFKDAQVQRLVVSMLLQKISGLNTPVDGAILFELAELSQDIVSATFVDVVKAFSTASQYTGSTDVMGKSVLAALTRLATVAAGRPELHSIFLVELLSLIIDKGVAENGKGSSKTERSTALLDLVPVLDAFLTGADLTSDRKLGAAEVALFRNVWYLFVLSGFLSTPARIAPWQRAALARIARATPCLLADARHDFIETELNFNSILKKSNYVLTPEAIRSELSAAVPQQSGNLRSLSAPQAIFLTTVLRLESLRAEAGRPSTILSYFEAEDSVTSPMHNTLAAIADHVNRTFITHFSELVTSHTIDTSIYVEVRAIILQCCHQYARVRAVSIRYLGHLLSSFPSLACEEKVVTVILELLTVLRRACQAEFMDEYTPVYSFPSLRGKFTLVLPDDYAIRNTVLNDLHHHGRTWLRAAITRAPFEMQGLLQDYIDSSSHVVDAHTSGVEDEMGKSVAIDLVRLLPTNSKGASLPSWGGWKADNSSQFARSFLARSHFSGDNTPTERGAILAEFTALADGQKSSKALKLADLRKLLYRAAAYVVKADDADVDVLHHVVAVPFRFFTEATITMGQEVWTWIVDARIDLESRIMVELTEQWAITIQKKQGLFSATVNRENPLDQETQYTPTNKDDMTKEYNLATQILQPHSILLTFISSRFQAFRYRSKDMVAACMLLLLRSLRACAIWSTHQLARELRMRLISFGFCLLQGSRLESSIEALFRSSLYTASLEWFAIRPGWSFGSNRIQLKSDLQTIEELRSTVAGDVPSYGLFVSSIDSDRKTTTLPGRLSLAAAKAEHSHRHSLLLALLDNEADRLKLWINPLLDSSRGPVPSGLSNNSENSLRQLARMAWACNPAVAIQLPERFKYPAMTAEVTRLVRTEPTRVQGYADALQFLIGESITPDVRRHLKHLLYWAPVPVVSALRFLFPKFGGDPILLQYALRVLEHHPVGVTFFYIPQVVQALRTDDLGYAERFIFETSKISQLFCHQIIWNMKANAYRGDAGEEEDPMKPTLDRMVDMIVESLSGEAKDFYQREFAFFDEVTSISAKLKPFIKSTKLVKKAKIDEEMAKIKVDPGVYLPSNPDGVVVDIDRLSGRPLQSHAKAPFMATFKVRRERKSSGTDQEAQDALIGLEEETENATKVAGFDTWQAAIFKVGDDCRQDVLALQIIAMHKNIFTSLGLDLLVTPYRVTATGPGCGVIDVVPNATSRDEMGRAKVNDLRSFFIMKYGSPDGVHFQKARINFIQSMAAYSLLCYIVQIKDRHNGNIMIDGHGCITHIVKFEPNSFKLSHEMVVLMGGLQSVGFRMFSELTVKAFLACRPYGQAVVDTAGLMMAAEFPSYKGQGTMDRLRERFRLDLSESDAAEYMKGVIANACENPRSIVYDEFQRITNAEETMDDLPVQSTSSFTSLSDLIATPNAAERPPIKVKVQRGSHACVRCKSRKQRCEGAGEGAGGCRNCKSVGATCIFAPRPERRRKTQAAQGDASSSRSQAVPTASQAIPMASAPPFRPAPPSASSSWTGELPTFRPESLPRSSHLDQARSLPTPAPAILSSTRHNNPDTESVGTSSSQEDESEDDVSWGDEAARGVAFLSLNASGNPVYVGPSSGFSWARAILGGLEGESKRPNAPRHFSNEVLNHSLKMPPSMHLPLPDDCLASIPNEVSEAVLSQCFRHLQPRYPFLDWLAVHDYWARKDAIMKEASQPNSSKESRTAAFFIWMLFAIGARLFYKVNVPSLAPAEAYYEKAMVHLDLILSLHNLENVQALLLMTMYSLRSNEAPSAWFLNRTTVGLTVSLGLHRKMRGGRALHMNNYVLQLRRRIFWSVYLVDRMLSMSLGRPLGIQDRDIDIELPLDVDCVEVNPTSANASTTGGTSMTSAIHQIKLKQIESQIQKHSYRVDRPVIESPDPLLALLDEWEQNIPPEASSPVCWQLPCVTRDFFLKRGYEARLHLLRPLAVSESCDPKYIKMLARYAAYCADCDKRITQNPTASLSLEGLRTTFLMALTLLHACRLDRKALTQSELERAIRATSNTLFAYIGQFGPEAQRFHDAFEDIANLVLEKNRATSPPEGASLSPMPAPSNDLWESLLNDHSMMNLDDEYTALFEQLGVPVDALVAPHDPGAFSPIAPLSFGDSSYSGFMAPADPFNFEFY